MIKPRILKSDKLGRDVLSRRDLKRIQKKIPTRIFLDKTSPTRLSVNRLTPEPNRQPPADRPDLAADSVIAAIGERRAKALGRNFYGWAELSVEDAEQNGRIVRSSPLPDNPQHADIALPAEAMNDEIAREIHAEELARKVKWRPRPKIERPDV